MNRKIKIKWLKALRSGKISQTRFQLKRTDDAGNNSYCCLGVLCEVMKGKYVGRNGYPPEEIQKKAGLTDNSIVKLSEMNDAKGLTFKQIAAYISQNL